MENNQVFNDTIRQAALELVQQYVYAKACDPLVMSYYDHTEKNHDFRIDITVERKEVLKADK